MLLLRLVAADMLWAPLTTTMTRIRSTTSTKGMQNAAYQTEIMPCSPPKFPLTASLSMPVTHITWTPCWPVNALLQVDCILAYNVFCIGPWVSGPHSATLPLQHDQCQHRAEVLYGKVAGGYRSLQLIRGWHACTAYCTKPAPNLLRLCAGRSLAFATASAPPCRMTSSRHGEWRA